MSINATTFPVSGLQTLRLSGSVQFTGTDSTVTNLVVLGANDNSTVKITHSAGNGTAPGSLTTLGDTITLGNGGTGASYAATNNLVITGTGADTITVGTGVNTVYSGPGADTITFAAHGGVDTFVISSQAGGSVANTLNNGGDTGPINTTSLTTWQATNVALGTFASNSVSTTLFDVVTGLRAGDVIDLSPSGATVGYGGTGAGAAIGGALQLNNFNTSANPVGYFTNLTSVTAADNAVELVRGVYNAVTQTFSGTTTGTDCLFIFDANATLAATNLVTEAIVLVGYAPTSTTSATLGLGGVVTLG